MIKIPPLHRYLLLLVRCFTLGLLLPAAAAAQAEPTANRIFYITPGGHDTDTGTAPDHAWATLQKAATTVTAGDTVIMTSGHYMMKEAILITAKGLPDRPILFKTTGATRPLLDFSKCNDLSTMKRAAGITFGAGAAYIVFDGFEVAHLPAAGIRAEHSSHITLSNCLVHDIQRVAISIGADNCLVENNEVYNACMASFGCNDQGGGWPQSVNTTRKPPIAPATVSTMAYNNVFRGNHVHDSWGEGIDAMYGDGTIIENNIIHDVMSVGIYLDHGNNTIIRGNSIFTTKDQHGRGPNRDPMNGILLGAEYLSDTLENPPHSHLKNIEIYNNVCVRVCKGIGQWIHEANTDNRNIYEGVRIYNNTIDTQNEAYPAIWFEAELIATTSGNECKNNILRGARSFSAAKGFVFENNLWVNGIPETGDHANSFSGAAGWVDPVASAKMEGYRLKPDSLALNRGQPIKALSFDKTGTPRQNPPDLGAWEMNDKPDVTPGTPVSALTLLNPITPPTFTPGVNVIRNPRFEEQSKKTADAASDWQATGDTEAVSLVAPGLPGVEIPLREPGHALALGKAGNFNTTVSQTVTGLVDGRYGLQVRMRSFGKSGKFSVEAETASGERLRNELPEKTQRQAQINDENSSSRRLWKQLSLSEIAVTGGTCTVRFHGEGAAGDRVLIDDVFLVRY